MHRAHQGPFRFDLFNSSHEKLPEVPGMFDLPEYRFHNRFSRSIDLRPDLGLEFPSHPIHPSCIHGQRTAFAGYFWFSVLLSIGRYVRGDFLLLEVFQILFRTTSAISQKLLRFLSGLLFNNGHHRLNLLFVIGLLSHGLSHN
jgi:hypothetical protein